MAVKKISDLISMEEEKIEFEWVILSYCIMNDHLIKHVYNKYKEKEIKTKHFSKYFQIVFKWVMEYFNKYEKAPRYTIRRIFKDNT